jgi:hypothetical protein
MADKGERIRGLLDSEPHAFQGALIPGDVAGDYVVT